MIAPEYFNNHIAVEGEIVVKRVPNDTGSVLVWNSTTKKISTRTVSEIVSDLNLVTTNTLGLYHKRDPAGALNNASDTHTNQTWFDYNYAGSGSLGSVINFSGFSGGYSTEVFGSYNDPNRVAIRTRNGDANQWNDPRWLWHDKNFDPNNYQPAGNYVTLDTDQNIDGKKLFNAYFDSYTPDGLFDSNARTLKVNTPSAAKLLFGYKDYGGGQYYPRIGFKNNGLTNWSAGPLGDNFVIGVNNNGAETFRIHPSGATSNVASNTQVFQRVYQGAYPDTAHQTGMLVLKMPQASPDQCMFSIDINIYGYESQYIGKINVSFYKYVSGLVIQNGSKALFNVTENFPTNIARVGIGSDGLVSILIGQPDTFWNSYISFEVERVQTHYANYHQDWSNGWTHALETDLSVYGSNIIVLPTDVTATKGWVENFANNNYIPRAVQHNNNFNSIGGYSTGGIYRANNDAGGVYHLYSPMLHMGAQDTAGQLQIKFNDGDISAGELVYRGGYNGNWTNWRRSWDNVNLPNPASLSDLNSYIPTSHSAYSITQNYLDGWFTYKGYGDVRLIRPENIETQKLQFGFTSWNNDNSGTYADFLHFGGYPDTSGGNQNLISFKKNGFGIRQWQGTSQSPVAYQSFVDYWNTSNFTQSDINNWNSTYNNQNNYIPLTGTGDFTGSITSPSNNIQFGNDSYYKAKIYLYDADNPEFNGYSFNFSANIEEGFHTNSSSGNEYMDLGAYWGAFYVNLGSSTNSSNFNFTVEGLIGNYKIPTQDGSYIQRKYLTDNYINNSTLLDYVSISTPQTIIGSKRFAVQPVKSDEGFQNTVYKAGQRNRIWSFGNADQLGLSYYQGAGLNPFIDEGIGFHFGDSTDYKVYIHESGRLYTKGTISAISSDSVGSGDTGNIGTNYKLILGNGNNFTASTRPNYGTAFWVEGTGDGYIQQQRFDGNNQAYNLRLQPYGGGLFYGGNEVATVNQLTNKVNNVDSVTGVAFDSGSVTGTPYFIHTNGTYVPMATQAWVGNNYPSYSFLAQNYALRGGNNATDTWVNASNALTNNPFIPGKILSSLGDVYLKEATYGQVMGMVNSAGIANGCPTDEWFHRIKMLHNNSAGYYTEIAVQMTGGNSMWFRRFENGSFGSSTNNGWIQVWDRESLPDYRLYGLGTINPVSAADLNNVSHTSILDINDSTINKPFGYGSVWTHRKGNVEYTQMAVEIFTGDIWSRAYSNATGSTAWVKSWNNGHFNSTDIANWNSAYNNKVNKSGDTMTGALNITSGHKIGDWRGTTQTGNYLSWLKYDGSKAIAYIGADGGSAIGNGGTGDNFVITSASGGDLILSSSSGIMQVNAQINTTNNGDSSQWQNVYQYALMNRGAAFTSNIDANNISQGTEIFSIELPNGSGNTNFPFNNYGTFMRMKSNSFTSDFAHEHNGSLWIRNWYNPAGASAKWRKLWDSVNLVNPATETWVNTNFIPKSHPVYNITQANINSWNASAGGSSHTHSNLNFLNNIDQWLGVGQAPLFSGVRLMNYLGYGQLALEEGYIGSEMGLVDLDNKVIYAGRENEYLKYGSSVNGFEALNVHFDAKLLSIGKEITNDEDKVQLAGNISVDTTNASGDSMQLILNPLYNTDGDVRDSRNAHIYIVTRGTVRLPNKPILGQRIEIFNYSKDDIEVMHDNVGTMFILQGFEKITGIVGGKGFIFDEKPVYAKLYDI